MNKNHYLGVMCLHNHEYKSTGKTLRDKHNGCIICKQISRAKWNKANQAHVTKYRKAYYQTPQAKDNRVKAQQAWVKRNPEIYAKRCKIRYASKEFKMGNHVRNIHNSKHLTDSYIKSVLSTKLKIAAANMSSKLINMKREQLIFTRKLKEIKKWVFSQHKLLNLQL